MLDLISFLVNLTFDIFLIGLPLLFFARRGLDSGKELGLKPKGILEDSSNSALLFLLLFFSSIFISFLLYLAGLNDLRVVEEVIESAVINSPLLLIYALLFRVFAEEVFFRGFLVKRIGILGSSFAFGFVHFLYGSFAEVVGAFFLGLILAWWFKKNNSLLQNYMGHFLYNSVIIIILVLT